MMKGFKSIIGLFAVVILTAGANLALAQDVPFSCVIEPRDIIEIGSPVEGLLEKVAVGRGDQVSKGDLLARLESGVEMAEADLARVRANSKTGLKSSRARLAYQAKRYTRAEKLFKREVVAKKSLDEYETEQHLAEIDVEQEEINARLAGLDLARAKGILDRRVIRSPLDGVVTERKLSPGEYVSAQVPILVLASLNPLHVEVYAPQAFYGRIKPGMTGLVSPDEPVGGRYEARVVVVDPVIDAASGTFGIRLELPNPEKRIPAGVKCRISFETAG